MMTKFHSMISRIKFAKRAVAALAALTFAAIASHQALAQQADPYAFEKKAYKPDGTPLSGPVNVGDTVKYVLSYKPGSTNSGPATIDDTLSPNQTYVAPTQGPGWTWGSSPYSVANKEQYKHPGFGPGQGSVALTVTGLPAPSSGDGDGTVPVPIRSLNKVFGVFHHAEDMTTTKKKMKIGCWNLDDLSLCSPSTVSNGGLFTPLWPQAVVRGNKFFFPGIQGGSITNGPVAIGCFDGSVGPSGAACGATLVGVNAGLGQIGGVVEDSNGNLLIAVKERLFCFKESGGALSVCPLWPVGGFISASPAPASPTTWTDTSNQVYLLSDPTNVVGRVYVGHGSGFVQCVQTTAAPTLCGSWPSTGVRPNGSSTGVSLHSIPAGSGGDGGVCLWNFGGTLAGCVDANGSTLSATAPTSVVAAVPIPFRFPNSAKVYFPSHHATQGPRCIAYSGANGISCLGFTSAVPTGFPNKAMQYGVAIDPSKPEKCMLALGDESLLWRFDYITGEPGCGTTSVSTPPVDQLYCNGAPDPAKFRWSSVTVGTPGAAGTLTIKQGTTTATLTFTSGTTNYAMPASIVAGTGPLTFLYTPTSGPGSVDIQVGYTSDRNPEICYQAKVSKCGPVFNEAVFKAGLNGTPVSSTRKVDLGVAKGSDCDVPPPVTCLSGKAEVTCGRVPGTYVITLKTQGNGGVTPDVVSITPKTAGVTIINPQVSYPVINGEVKITVAGASLGQSLEFDMEGSILNAGSVEGSDLCCNGTIKVEIPKDLPCEKSTVDVTKTCEPAVYRKYALGPAIDAIGWVASCKITFKTTGPQTRTLSVADQLSGGGTLLGVNSTTTPPWTCGPSGCSINGNQLNQTASTSEFTAQVAFTTKGGALEAKNCATVYGRQKPLDRDCTKITVDDPKEPEVTIAKVCEPARQMDSPVLQFGAKCTITVTTTGAIQTHLVVSDNLTGNGQVTSFTNTSTPAWTCIPGQCDMEGSNLNQTSSVSTFDAFVTFPVGQGADQATARNCAKLGFDAHPVGESCADIKAEDDKFKLDVKKDCSGVIALGANGPWAGSCKVTVTATGGPRPPFIAISDVISDVNATRTPPISMTNMVSADPWTCAAPSGAGGLLNCTIAGNAFPASGTSTLDIQVYVPIGVKSGEAKNCVKAAGASDAQTLSPSNPPVSTEQICVPLPGGTDTPPPPYDGTISVTKTCDPAAPNGATNNWGAGQDQGGGSPQPTHQAICQVTVTGAGSLPPVIELTESMMSWAPAAGSPMQINISNMTSPQNWQFPPFPVGQGSSTAVPGTPYAGAPAIATLSSADLLAAGGQSTITVTAQFMNAGWASESQNCVQASGVSTPGAAPGVQSQQVCVPFTTSPAVQANMETIKTCQPGVESANGGFDVHCKIIVNLNATQIPNVVTVREYLSPWSSASSPSIVSLTSTDGWQMPGLPVTAGANAQMTISGSDFPASGHSEIFATVHLDSLSMFSDFQNCVYGLAGATPYNGDYGSPMACVPLLPPQTSIQKLACDPATATNAGDLCRCRFDNMTPVSKTACECKDGFTLKAGQGCVRKVVEPKCDLATTIAKGGKCLCEYKNMVQTSASACACAKGFKFAPGKGCFKPEPVCKKGERFEPKRGRCEPVCAKGFDYNPKRNACIQRQPECKPGTKFNPKNGKCVPVQPICRKPFVYDPKRNACVEVIRRCEPGTIPVNGRCVRIPKCGFGQIPVPGTGICVSIGGGGGHDRPKCNPAVQECG